MRHSNAGLAIPTFPLAFGRVIPEFVTPGIAIHFAHRAGAIVVFLFVLASTWTAWRNFRREQQLFIPAMALFLLVFIQISLGGLTVLTAKAVIPATAHVVVGALMLANSLILTLRSYRLIDRGIEGAEFEPACVIVEIG